MAKTNTGNESIADDPTARISMKQSNTFPFRLHEMLDTVTKEGSEHVVSWIPGNDIAFKVHKPAIFVETIMPRFFQQTKYKSFQRQCNLWGFERLLHGSEKGGYCHPDGYFYRGKPSLVSKMIRRKIKRRPSTMEDGVNGNEATSASSSMPQPSQVMAVQSSQHHPQQRRPSMVSCSSSQNSVDVFVQPPSVAPITLPKTGYYEVPASPSMVSYYGTNSSVGTASLTTSPASDLASEGLYLPPPPPPPTNTNQQQEIAAASEPDALFMEGLSAFFEDGADISIVSEEGVGVPHGVPVPPPPPAMHGTYQQQQQHRLQPKHQQHQRRLSLELFVASRELNSEGIILDLLTGSDSLQKSLEMELMCPVAQPRV